MTVPFSPMTTMCDDFDKILVVGEFTILGTKEYAIAQHRDEDTVHDFTPSCMFESALDRAITWAHPGI